MLEFLIYFQFVIGFILLIKGADLLVNSAASLAKRTSISDMIIGLTVVSFGTSAPELVVNIIASINASSSLALGNVIGSNIANILLILGISSIIAPLVVSKKAIWQDIPMNLLAVVIFAILVNDQLLDPVSYCPSKNGVSDCNFLGRGDALILLIFFALFIYYVARRSRSETKIEEGAKMSLWKAIFFIIIGLGGLLLGGNWIVKGAVHISRMIGLDEAFIGIAIIGVGTSLPEVAASAVAAYRGKSDIAIGNALGSNLFNILWVLALSAFLQPLNYDTNLNIDLFMMGFAILLLYTSVISSKIRKLDFAKGVLFLSVYLTYILFLIFIKS